MPDYSFEISGKKYKFHSDTDLSDTDLQSAMAQLSKPETPAPLPGSAGQQHLTPADYQPKTLPPIYTPPAQAQTQGQRGVPPTVATSPFAPYATQGIVQNGHRQVARGPKPGPLSPQEQAQVQVFAQAPTPAYQQPVAQQLEGITNRLGKTAPIPAKPIDLASRAKQIVDASVAAGLQGNPAERTLQFLGKLASFAFGYGGQAIENPAGFARALQGAQPGTLAEAVRQELGKRGLWQQIMGANGENPFKGAFPERTGELAAQPTKTLPQAIAKAGVEFGTPTNAAIMATMGPLGKLGELGKIGASIASGVFGVQGADMVQKGLRHFATTGNIDDIAQAIVGAGQMIGSAGHFKAEQSAAMDRAFADYHAEKSARQLQEHAVNEPFRQAHEQANQKAQPGIKATGEKPATPNAAHAVEGNFALPDVKTMATAFRQGRQSFPVPDAQTALKTVVALKAEAPDLIVQGTKAADGTFTVSAVPKPGAAPPVEAPQGEPNAISQHQAGTIFQRQPEQTGGAGGERGGVQPGQQRQETPTQGAAAETKAPQEGQVNPLRAIAPTVPTVDGMIKITDLQKAAQAAHPDMTPQQFGAHVAELLNSREYDHEGPSGNVRGTMLEMGGRRVPTYGIRHVAKPAEAPAITPPLQEAKPAEPAIETVGIKKAKTEEERSARGADQLPQPETQTFDEIAEKGKQAIANGKIDPGALARDVAEKSQALNKEQFGALLADRLRLLQLANQQKTAVDAAIDAKDRVAIAKAQDAYRETIGHLDTNQRAVNNAKTEWAQSGHALQIEMNLNTGDRVAVLREARRQRGGDLPPAEAARIEGIVKRLNEAEKALKAHEDAAKGLAETVTPETRRAQKRVSLQQTRAEAVRDIKKALARQSLNVGPEQLIAATPHVVKWFKAAAQEQGMNLQDFVAEVRKEFPAFTDRHIRDMVSGYGRTPEGRQRTETQRRISEMTKEAELLSRLEDELEGQHTTGKAIGKPVDNEAAAKLRGQIQEIHDNRAKAAAAKEKADKLDAAIKTLEAQVKSGNVPKPPKGTPKPKSAQETRLAQLRQEVAKARAEQKKLTDLADRLDKERQGIDTRQPSKPATPESPQAAKLRAEINQHQADRKAKAEIADIAEQLRTGNYRDTTKPAAQAKSALQQELADARKALNKAKNPPMSQDTKDANSIARRKKAITAQIADLQDQLDTNTFKGSTAKRTAPTDPELERLTRLRDVAKQQVKNAIARQTPGHTASQVSTFIKAGLLSGPQTIGKIAASHGTFLAMEEVKRIPASILDMAHSAVTGKDRQVAGMDVGAAWRAAHQAATAGVRDAIELFKHGDIGLAAQRAARGDTSPIAQMAHAYENMHGEFDSKSKLLNAYVNTVMRSHGAMYEVMKRYALARALEEQATLGAMAQRKAAGGMTREQFQTARQTLLDNPSDTMVGNAIAAAEVATFINKNAFTNMVSGAKMGATPTGAFILDRLAPFPKVPANVAARTVEYAGLGIPVETAKVVNAAIRKTMTEEQWTNFANSFGRGSTGAGVLALGAYLAAKGLANTTDWQTEEKKGRTPGSLKIMGHEIQMQGAAPFGPLLMAGASLYAASKKESGKKSGPAAKAAWTALTEQPLLSAAETISRMKEDVTGGYVPAAIGKLIAGQTVPSLFAQIAAIKDKHTLREQKTFIAPFKYRTPILRETLPKKEPKGGGNPYKTTGNSLKMPTFNPGKG